LVIQEAFATKTPVIATNIGGMAEFVSHENNGLLFERNSSEDLAKQIRRIVDERDLLGRLSNFTNKVRTIEEEVVALDRIYAQLIEQKPL
jgi:glycosyltransferase involved in cell wall biosynthesis